MPILTLIITMITLGTSQIIFDFNQASNIQKWRVVDDVVMGGRSSGSFNLNDQGHGTFYGFISLENNGGFSSVRCKPGRMLTEDFTHVKLKVKGDGKNYQFRLKKNANDYHSYISTFYTTGSWQEIRIPLNQMYPSFRGRKLLRPNFSGPHIEEIAFLIANKTEERFELIIDKIELV